MIPSYGVVIRSKLAQNKCHIIRQLARCVSHQLNQSLCRQFGRMLTAGLDDALCRCVLEQTVGCEEEMAGLLQPSKRNSPRAARANERLALLCLRELRVRS